MFVSLALSATFISEARGEEQSAGSGSSPSATAYQPEKDIKQLDLPKMYELVDAAIERSGHYISDYESKLYELKRLLANSNDNSHRLMLTQQLSEMYESFNGDSTLAYTLRAMEMGRQWDMPEVVANSQVRMAYLCTFLGSQTESLTILKRINKSDLTQDGLCNYYHAYMMVYGNLGGNCQIPAMRDEFFQLHHIYKDSLLSIAPKGSELYLGHRQPQLVEEGKYDEALKINDERLNMTQEGTHDNAIISYSRYEVYRAMGNTDMAKYWLCKSALDDIRNAVMDQTSLISLAEMLSADGDMDRADRYISFTWDCNRRYSPRMRLWQIAPLLTAIEGSFQAKLDRKSRILTVAIVAASILLVVLLFFAIHFRQKRKQLSHAKAELEESNKRLAGANEILRALKHQPVDDRF